MATKNGKKCIMITENRPKMLKEFLQEFNNQPSSLPRSRSRSRAAAEAALTSFQKLLTAVKSFQQRSSSSQPIVLTRSISRTLLDRFSVKKKNRGRKSKNDEGMIHKIKVKDILRWKSFRALEEPTKPLDSPSHCEYNSLVLQDDDESTCRDILFRKNATTNLTTSTTTTTRSSSSSSNRYDIRDGLRSRSESGSSWGENEDLGFTADELPRWRGNSSEDGKKWDQSNDDVVATVSDVGPEDDNHRMTMEDEKEQHSPVSVLDSPFSEELSDHEFDSLFDKRLANMERTKQSLLQRIQCFENLAGVSYEDDDAELVEHIEEEQEEEPRKGDDVIVAKTMAYINKAIGKLVRGEHDFDAREVCIKDMEKQRQWSLFEEEKEEFRVEVEVFVLNDLVNEVLVDLFG